MARAIQIEVVFNDPATGERIVGASQTVENVTDDEAQIVAANLAYGLVEDSSDWRYQDEE